MSNQLRTMRRRIAKKIGTTEDKLKKALVKMEEERKNEEHAAKLRKAYEKNLGLRP